MIKFGYYSVNIGNRKGVVTVAINRPDKDDPEQLHIASFAICSPKDMFRKALGRRIAEGRLGSNKAVTVRYNGSVPEVIEKALQEAMSKNLSLPENDRWLPAWLIRAYKRNALKYGLRDEVAQAA